MTSALVTFEAKTGWPALREHLSGRLPEHDLALMDQAVGFALNRHGEQTRPAGEPYGEHLLEVVRVLAEAVGVTDIDILRAGVLHDVVEDTDCSLEEVSARFGQRVAVLVDWVTKPEPSDGQTPAEARAAYLTRLQGAPADAILIKLADRLSNVQRLDTHPRLAKRRSYYRETVCSIVPFARTDPWFHQWYTTWTAVFSHLAEDETDTQPS